MMTIGEENEESHVRPQGSVRFAIEPAASFTGAGLDCRNGHALVRFKIGTSTSGFSSHRCDECTNKGIAYPQNIWRCVSCNYDLCTECAGDNSSPRSQTAPTRLAHETHLVFIVDASGSMGGPVDATRSESRTRLAQCLACCGNEVKNLVNRKGTTGAAGRTDFLCSLITFNDAASVVIDKEPVDAAFAERFDSLVEGVVAGGGTSYTNGLKKCNELVQNLQRQMARVNIFFLSDGRPSNVENHGDELHLNEIRKLESKFKTQLMFFSVGVGDEARKYLRQMSNVVKNRLSDRHAYLEEAREDLQMIDGKISSQLASSLTATFSKFTETVLSNASGMNGNHHPGKHRGKKLPAPKCEKFARIDYQDEKWGWKCYQARLLDPEREFRPDCDFTESVEIRALPFAYGSERNAFMLKLSNGRLVVAKELRDRDVVSRV